MGFIFRNPFVTKKQKMRGVLNVNMAKACLKMAEEADNKGDIESFVSYARTTMIYMNDAAKCFGFRNIADFYKYQETHNTK